MGRNNSENRKYANKEEEGRWEGVREGKVNKVKKREEKNETKKAKEKS